MQIIRIHICTSHVVGQHSICIHTTSMYKTHSGSTLYTMCMSHMVHMVRMHTIDAIYIYIYIYIHMNSCMDLYASVHESMWHVQGAAPEAAPGGAGAGTLGTRRAPDGGRRHRHVEGQREGRQVGDEAGLVGRPRPAPELRLVACAAHVLPYSLPLTLLRSPANQPSVAGASVTCNLSLCAKFLVAVCSCGCRGWWHAYIMLINP